MQTASKTEVELTDRFAAFGERLPDLQCAFVEVYLRENGETDFSKQVSGYETGLKGLKQSMRREIRRLEAEQLA